MKNKYKDVLDTNEFNNTHKEIKKAYKEYKRTFKMYQKALVKSAKKFQPYDYSYLMQIMYIGINFLASYLLNPKLVWQDTSANSNYAKDMQTLEWSVKLIAEIQNICKTTGDLAKVIELENQLLDLLRNYRTDWWD